MILVSFLVRDVLVRICGLLQFLFDLGGGVILALWWVLLEVVLLRDPISCVLGVIVIFLR